MLMTVYGDSGEVVSREVVDITIVNTAEELSDLFDNPQPRRRERDDVRRLRRT
jgi:hypothetical protein